MKYGISSKSDRVFLVLFSLALLFFSGIRCVKMQPANSLNAPRFLEVEAKAESGGAGGNEKEVAMTLHVHPPEASTEEVMNGLKDLETLENKNRQDDNEDMLDEKKKLVEIQRVRVYDIVRSSLSALVSLIPNPIKASIRKATRDIALDRGKSGFAFRAQNHQQRDVVKDEIQETTRESQAKTHDGMFANYKFQENDEFSEGNLENLFYNQVWDSKELPAEREGMLDLRADKDDGMNYRNDTSLEAAIHSVQKDISAFEETNREEREGVSMNDELNNPNTGGTRMVMQGSESHQTQGYSSSASDLQTGTPYQWPGGYPYGPQVVGMSPFIGQTQMYDTQQ